jgi:AcrR family transcriptional regulator
MGLGGDAVDTSHRFADEHGLESLSMRRLAERFGVGTMSLYRYVPGRAELLDLMVDRVSVKATTTERIGFIGRGERYTIFCGGSL